MARRGVLTVLAVLTALSLNGCGDSASYRFRITVKIETLQGVKSGSSVMETFASRIIVLDPKNPSGSGGLKGEAVVVDLPSGPVFALLKTSDAGDGLDKAATLALAPQTKRGDFDAYLATVRHLGGWFGSAKAELPRKDWPMMVRFRDINDPKSVEQVEPEAIGVKRILLETTGDAVTAGIEKRLRRLGDRGLVVSGPTINPNLTRTIRHETFWQGPK